MAVNLEQWDPNIKSPGVEQSPGGAYRNPDLVIPDWKSITEGWQKMQDSITKGYGGFLKGKEEQAKKLEEDDKKRQDENSKYKKKDLTIVPGIDANNQKNLIDFVENKIATHGNYADQTEKVKQEWMKEIEELGITRSALETLAKEWNENNDIDYSKLGLDPEMAKFLNRMFTDKDSMKRIEKKDGVLGIYYTTGGEEKTEGASALQRDPFSGELVGKTTQEEKFMPLINIQAAVSTYTDAGEEKSEMLQRVKVFADKYEEEIKKVAAGTGDYKGFTKEQRVAQNKLLYANLQRHIAGDSYSKRDKAFIFNNFFGEENRYTRYDADTMNESFNERFEIFVNEQFGIVPPMYTADEIPETVETGETTLMGGPDGKTVLGTVDNAILSQVKSVYTDIFKPLSEHPKEGYGVVGAESSEEEGKYIVRHKDGKTQALWNALEAGRDKFGSGAFGWNSVQEHLDQVLAKNAAKQTLTKAEQGVLREYKAYKGSFDENVDLTSNMPDKYTNVNFNRKDQKITFRDDDDKEIIKDLTLESHRTWVMQQLMQASGHGSTKMDTSIDTIIKYLVGSEDFGATFEKYKKPKPKLD